MSEEILSKLAQAVIDGESDDAVALAKQSLEEGIDPLLSITEGLTKGISKVGELFSEGEYYLPELILGANTMQDALEILEPALKGGQKREVVATIVMGTVEGDLHGIGKTLVGTMLTANGFKVIDVGIDKPASVFIKAVRENDAIILGASALLTTTMIQQEKIIEALKSEGLEGKVKVMIGGAPVTQSYADQIGADGFAEDAISAVDLAFRLADAPE